MKLPLQITVRNVSLSRAAKNNIREKADKLDQFYGSIMSCRVAVEAVNRRQQQGVLYSVHIDLTIPGKELAVKRERHEDVYVAIRDAFDAARLQLEDYACRERGDVKSHESTPHGRVISLFPELEYGFLETPDGREIYFHRNSVLHEDFDRMEIGMEVRFAEEAGDQGPQASTVEVLSKHHV